MIGASKQIHAVLCVNAVGAIGNDGRLLYSFAADTKHFRELTRESAVVMGSTTFEQVGALPNRFNIVLTSGKQGISKGVLFCRHVSDVLDEFGRSPFRNLYVIGGAKVFRSFLPFYDSLELTMVADSRSGDTSIDLLSVLPMFRHEPSMDIDLGNCVDRIGGSSYPVVIRRWSRVDGRKLY